MRSLGHLQIHEIKLAPGQEHQEAAGGWRFLRIASGAAYWLDNVHPRALAEREMLILPPVVQGLIRASQINHVILHQFNFAPDLLCGFFTLAERQFFETRRAQVTQGLQVMPSTHPVTQKFAALAASEPEQCGLAQRTELLSLVAAVFDKEMGRFRRPPRPAPPPNTDFIN